MIERLEPLIGDWRVTTSLGDVEARSTFEWTLGGAYVLQRTEIDIPEAPDALCMIGVGEEGFTQHFFDSRGYARVYAMTFEDGLWTLTRERPDFTPLDFAQRYTGELSADGTRIDGRWEIRESGAAEYRRDFDLSYIRS